MIPANGKLVALDALIAAITARRRKISPARALLVGISGIDASGKGFVTGRLAKLLGTRPTGIADPDDKVAVIAADGWLSLPHVRIDRARYASGKCGFHPA